MQRSPCHAETLKMLETARDALDAIDDEDIDSVTLLEVWEARGAIQRAVRKHKEAL